MSTLLQDTKPPIYDIDWNDHDLIPPINIC